MAERFSRSDLPESTPVPSPLAGLPPRVSFWLSLGRSQVSAFIASLADFGVTFAVTEWGGVWYVLSTGLGALSGAIVNFRLNRVWSFAATDGLWHRQAVRYAVVSAGSLLLNMLGVYAITEGFGLAYGYSKLIISLLVAVLFNFPLHRRYVFR